jgi:hypothetical protein
MKDRHAGARAARSVPFAAALALIGAAAAAQPPARAPAPPPTPRQAAPYDLTGQWVAVVTDDWRWRMITPPPGDYASVPLTAAGRETATAWDREADIRDGNECRPTARRASCACRGECGSAGRTTPR